VDLMVIAVENGPDRMIFAGPTLSHYEFEGAATQRYSDKEWRDLLPTAACPSRPSWTQSYLVSANRDESGPDAGYLQRVTPSRRRNRRGLPG
jgi:hypothetical protein